jgi:hypothetical protein
MQRWLGHHYRIFVIAMITLVAYGLLLPWTGFYWDDWPFAWFARSLGPSEFIPAFLPYRPFLGPIFYFTTSLVPPIPIYWQLFALVIRFGIGLAAWWAFSQVFPKRPHLSYMLGLLMLVFPGYSQHWVAFTHINQELIPFISYLLSFGFTFKALRSPHPRPYLVIALLFQIIGIFPTEYFFGLEALRFLFLVNHYDGGIQERATKAFRTWVPYLVIWVMNALWLFVYYKFGPYHSYAVVVSDSSLIDILGQFLDAILKAGFYVWWRIIEITISTIRTPVSFLTIGLLAISFVTLSILFLKVKYKDELEKVSLHWTLILLGISGLLLGRVPSVVAGLPMKLDTSADRLMVSMMMGGCLFIAGLVEGATKNLRVKILLYVMLISFGIGQQFFNANIFRRDWERQADVYWQFAWRMPGLEPGTTILTNVIPVDYETDLSLTAPINWMYAPDYTRENLPYIILYTTKRLGGPTLPSLRPGTRISYAYRTVDFIGSTSSVVVIYMPENGCLRVLDPARRDDLVYPNLPGNLSDAIPLSDPSRILVKVDSPAVPMFLKEPEHTWCYYFTRAELYRQQGNYQQVVKLGNEAISLGYKPNDMVEWMVFIEAYALTGDWRTAQELSLSALSSDGQVQREICSVWRRLFAMDLGGSSVNLTDVLKSLNCDW